MQSSKHRIGLSFIALVGLNLLAGVAHAQQAAPEAAPPEMPILEGFKVQFSPSEPSFASEGVRYLATWTPGYLDVCNIFNAQGEPQSVLVHLYDSELARLKLTGSKAYEYLTDAISSAGTIFFADSTSSTWLSSANSVFAEFNNFTFEGDGRGTPWSVHRAFLRHPSGEASENVMFMHYASTPSEYRGYTVIPMPMGDPVLKGAVSLSRWPLVYSYALNRWLYATTVPSPRRPEQSQPFFYDYKTGAWMPALNTYWTNLRWVEKHPPYPQGTD